MVQTLGDPVRIVLDNADQLVYPKSPLEPAWNSSALDPSVPHTIAIVKANFKADFKDEEYMSFYSLLVTHPDPPGDTKDTATKVLSVSTSPGTSSIPNSSESSSPLSTQQSTTEPLLSGAKLAGVIVGCITVPVLIIAIILYRRRMISKRKAASTAYWDYITSRAQQPPGGPSPPTPPEEVINGAEAKEVP
jgi:hypothetical protein